jgi:hypothetical protein
MDTYNRVGLQVATAPAFDLWLEWEHKDFIQPLPSHDPVDDFANVQVRLPDGLRYALNVWTFGFMQRARFPWPYQEGVGEPAEYLLPPDLFVERLDRPTLEKVVARMLANGEMNAAWLCQPEVPGSPPGNDNEKGKL